MKSPVILNLIFSVILATGLFLLFPAELLASNLTFALGVIIGGLVIPLVTQAFTQRSIEMPAVSKSQTTLYVGNLPYKATEQAVKEHFSAIGYVASVRLMKDRRTGKRKGYGFVEVDSQAAHDMIDNLNDTEFQERTLKVRLAKEKAE